MIWVGNTNSFLTCKILKPQNILAITCLTLGSYVFDLKTGIITANANDKACMDEQMSKSLVRFQCMT